MKSAIRTGIIGFGGAGRAHAFYYSKIAGCRLAKVYDAKPEGLKRAAGLPASVERHSDLDGFWNDLDAVSICTPDSTHAEYIKLALERGLHVICEKPLTDSIEGIRKIREAEKNSGRVVSVLHQMRFVPLNKIIKSVLVNNGLGNVSYLEGYYIHNLTRRAFAYDTWRQNDNATPLLYAGCHFIDLLRWFADEEIVEVYAAANHRAFPEYPESDFNAAILRFASGVIGKVLVAFGAAGPQDHSVRIYGQKGSIENNVLFSEESKRRIIYSPRLIQTQMLGPASDLPSFLGNLYRQIRINLPPYMMGKSFETLNALFPRRDGEYYTRFYPLRLYEHGLACIEAIRDFVNAVNDGVKPLCSVDESAKTVLAGLAGIESFRTQKPVRVKRLNEIL